MIDRIKTVWGGIVFPAMMAAYGIYCVRVKEAWLPLPGRSHVFSHSPGMEIRGQSAMFLGVSYVSLGLSLHFYSFWVATDRVRKWNELAAISFGGLFVISFVCGAWKAVEALF